MSINSYEYRLDDNAAVKAMVILLHGYGSNGTDLLSLAPELEAAIPGAVFVSPDAPHSWEGDTMGAFQWYSLNDKAASKVEYEESIHMLYKFVLKKLEEYQLTKEQLVIAGFSQGGMMSLHSPCWLSDHMPVGIISFSGFIHRHLMMSAKQYNGRVLLTHGTEDYVVPFSEMTKAEGAMRNLGAQVEALAVKSLGHGIDYHCINTASKFLSSLPIAT